MLKEFSLLGRRFKPYALRHLLSSAVIQGRITHRKEYVKYFLSKFNRIDLDARAHGGGYGNALKELAFDSRRSCLDDCI